MENYGKNKYGRKYKVPGYVGKPFVSLSGRIPGKYPWLYFKLNCGIVQVTKFGF
jgi:hypothetical protein